MINNIADLPTVGQKVVTNENPTMEVEVLICVGVTQDPEVPEIMYAFLASEDDSENEHVENGMKYHKMLGYMKM